MAACACVVWMLSAGAAVAPAQLVPPLDLEPGPAGQGASLLVAVDAPLLSSGGRAADAITFALPRGTRIDPTSVRALCGRDERAACPEESRIGFGRYVVAVRDFASWGGNAELVWSIDASLGDPLRRGDPASVVLSAKLLALDSVATFLTPALGAEVPATTTTVGRLVPRGSGAELRFPELPVDLDVAAPTTAAPSRLELSLTAVRRTRQNFVRRIRVRTLSGYEVRRIPDHRLIGHHLFRAPRSCAGSWASEIRVGFGARVKRTAGRIPCAKG